MNLSESQKKYLRGLGHQLKPVVMVADSGLSEAVQAEFEHAIGHHELIKVRVRVGDRAARDEIIRQICAAGDATLIKRIGNIALVYRPNPDKPRIKLPRASAEPQT